MTAGRGSARSETVEALVLPAESESRSHGIYNDHSGRLEALLQSDLANSVQLSKCLSDELNNDHTP